MKYQLRLATGALAAIALLTFACSSGGASSGSSAGKLHVVAVENFWASIVSQIGGDHVQVNTIITNPDTDPHDYEATAQDGRAIASARYVVYNGAGYDTWAEKILNANKSSGRKVLAVANLAGRKDGDNPHVWYNPGIVMKVVDQVTADLKALDAADAAYFDEQAATFKTTGLKEYNALRAQIKQQYSGVPVGSTESIFEDLAADLGLDDVTPASFQKATSEGIDVSPKDKTTVEQQITGKQIKVLVFNSQNSTPDIQSLVGAAKSGGIPVVALTETLDPADATFQAWQSAQLTSLMQALKQATGR